ncbi:MAG: energy-coupling factor transporter transmembrane component T [Microbacterium sp.]
MTAFDIGADRIVRPGPIAPRAALARITASLVISLPLVLTLDRVSASVALLLSAPLLLCAGLRWREFWLRTAVLWIGAPLGALTISLYGRSSGEVFFDWAFMRVSEGSLTLAVATAIRVLAIGLPAVCLCSTIDPTELADDLSQRLRLPARFVIGALVGMRMMSLLAEDWRQLELARRARGVADQGRIRRLLGMAFALFVLAIRRGSSLATAMEARAFGAPGARTWARSSRWDRRDTALVLIAAVIPAAALSCAVALGTWNSIFTGG